MPDDTVEASNPVLGSFKFSGQNINTVATLAALVLIAIVAYVLNAHAGDAKETGKAVAQELKEANREVANTLKESNKDVAKVLQELSRAMREQNCLSQFATAVERSKNAELCKRISQ